MGAAPGPHAEVPPDLRLTREQALRLWTTAAAPCEHAEHRKGSIATGRLADLVMLDEDVMAVEDELQRLIPVLTLAGGRVVYECGR